MPDSEPQPPWYVSAFDRSYLERYHQRDDREAARQIEFLQRSGQFNHGSRVLDLCCGAGRHSVRMAGLGARPIGVDLSLDLLQEARRDGRSASVLIPWARADMRRLPFRSACFDLDIQMFTAFGYFVKDSENQQVLAEVARVLSPGGSYVLDLLNRTRVVRTLVPESTDTREDGTVIHQQRRFDASSRRIEKQILETTAEGVETRRFESVRVFDREEIAAWLLAVRLEVVELHGRFDESAFDPEQSERLIVFSRKQIQPDQRMLSKA